MKTHVKCTQVIYHVDNHHEMLMICQLYKVGIDSLVSLADSDISVKQSQ